jgi:hypothetical protein
VPNTVATSGTTRSTTFMRLSSVLPVPPPKRSMASVTTRKKSA